MKPYLLNYQEYGTTNHAFMSMTQIRKPCLIVFVEGLSVGSIRLESNGRFLFRASSLAFHMIQLMDFGIWMRIMSTRFWLVCGFDKARLFVEASLSLECVFPNLIIGTRSGNLWLVCKIVPFDWVMGIRPHNIHIITYPLKFFCVFVSTSCLLEGGKPPFPSITFLQLLG